MASLTKLSRSLGETMKSESRFRATPRKLAPSPSMVVAVIALVVALSGTAYAAATINGKNIKKGTITSKQIKDKTITGTDIKDGTIAGKDVKAGTLTADKIAAGVIPTVTPTPIASVSSTTDFTVPLGGGDATGMTLDYTVPAGANKIVVTFNVSCEVSTTVDGQSLAARIKVDGTDAAPVAYQTICGPSDEDGTANTGSGGDVTASGGTIVRTIAASPGKHTVQAQGAQLLLATGKFTSMSMVVTSGS